MPSRARHGTIPLSYSSNSADAYRQILFAVPNEVGSPRRRSGSGAVGSPRRLSLLRPIAPNSDDYISSNDGGENVEMASCSVADLLSGLTSPPKTSEAIDAEFDVHHQPTPLMPVPAMAELSGDENYVTLDPMEIDLPRIDVQIHIA